MIVTRSGGNSGFVLSSHVGWFRSRGKASTILQMRSGVRRMIYGGNGIPRNNWLNRVLLLRGIPRGAGTTPNELNYKPRTSTTMQSRITQAKFSTIESSLLGSEDSDSDLMLPENNQPYKLSKIRQYDEPCSPNQYSDIQIVDIHNLSKQRTAYYGRTKPKSGLKQAISWLCKLFCGRHSRKHSVSQSFALRWHSVFDSVWWIWFR